MSSLKKTVGRVVEDEKTIFLKELGSRIKSIRLRHNLTRADFASALMVRVKTLSEIEKGKRQPTGRLLFALREYFEVSEVWLMTGRRGALRESQDRKMEETMNLLGMFKMLSESNRDKILNITKILIEKRHIDIQKRKKRNAGRQAAEKTGFDSGCLAG